MTDFEVMFPPNSKIFVRIWTLAIIIDRPTDYIGREENQMIEQILAIFGQGKIWIISGLESDLKSSVSERLEEYGMSLSDAVVVE